MRWRHGDRETKREREGEREREKQTLRLRERETGGIKSVPRYDTHRLSMRKPEREKDRDRDRGNEMETWRQRD